MRGRKITAKAAWVMMVAGGLSVGAVSCGGRSGVGGKTGTGAAGPVTRAAVVAAGGGVDIITREQWGSKPQVIPESYRQVPRLITIHHAGVLWKGDEDPAAKARNLQSWGQRDKKWPDIPYHYLIAPDGRVYEARDWHFRPESNTNYDLNGVLNIQLWGHFDEQRVSIEQLRSTVELIAKLCQTLPVEPKLDPETIRGHKDAAPGQTTCPGKDFHRYIEQGLIKRWVKERLAGREPRIALLPALPGGPTTQIPTTGPTATTRPAVR